MPIDQDEFRGAPSFLVLHRKMLPVMTSVTYENFVYLDGPRELLHRKYVDSRTPRLTQWDLERYGEPSGVKAMNVDD